MRILVFNTLYQDDDFQLQLEPCGNGALVHLDLYKWSKSSAQKLLDLRQAVEKQLQEMGFKDILFYHPDQPDHWKKLVSQFLQYSPLFYLENGHVVYGRRIS